MVLALAVTSEGDGCRGAFALAFRETSRIDGLILPHTTASVAHGRLYDDTCRNRLEPPLPFSNVRNGHGPRQVTDLAVGRHIPRQRPESGPLVKPAPVVGP